MPILEIRELSKSRAIALWKVTEDLDTLFRLSTLTAKETSLLNSYKNELKKREWLAGRLTIKELLKSLTLDYEGIKKNGDGKPILNLENGEISLTHSFPYVAAIYDRQDEVGIDLEQPKEKLKRIARKFLNDTELKFTKDDITKLCIYWCAKEALYKIHSSRGLIFRENLFVHQFELKQAGLISGSIIVNNTEKKYNLQYSVKQDYVLVYNV